MKLYRINFINEITECKVLKETNKTYVYRWPDSTSKWTVKKKNVNAPREDFTKNIATSRENLIKATIESINYQIRNYQVRIDRLQQQKEHFQTIK